MLGSSKRIKPLILILLIVGLFIGCEDEEDCPIPNCTFKQKVEGSILGVDSRECACCGGYFIKIGEETYRFYEEPSCSDLALDVSDYAFPLEVWVDWKADPDACMGDEILLEKIKQK
ncbi:MAG: hypothetical protein AAGC85_01335 [Bacteroidota bacterium]